MFRFKLSPGWKSVLGGFMIHLVLGTLYCWGIITTAVTAHLRKYHENLMYNQTLMVYSTALLFQGLTMLLGGLMGKWLGPRKTCLIGGYIIVLGTYLSALATSLSVLLITSGAMFGIGVGICYSSPIVCATTWLPQRKGLVTGIIVGGFGGGACGFGLLATLILQWSPEARADKLINGYYDPNSAIANMVPTLYLTLGTAYFIFITIGSFLLVEHTSTTTTSGDSNQQHHDEKCDRVHIRSIEEMDDYGHNPIRIDATYNHICKSKYSGSISTELQSKPQKCNNDNSSYLAVRALDDDSLGVGVGVEMLSPVHFPSHVTTTTTTSHPPLVDNDFERYHDDKEDISISLHDVSNLIASTEQQHNESIKAEERLESHPITYLSNHHHQNIEQQQGNDIINMDTSMVSASDIMPSISMGPWDVIRDVLGWHVASCFASTAIGGMFIAGTYKTYGQQSFTHDETFLSALGSSAAVFNASGRVVWGALADKMGAVNTLILLSIVFSLLQFSYSFTPSFGEATFAIWTYAIFFFEGGNFVLYVPIVLQLFGITHAGSNYGLIFSCYSLCNVISIFIIAALDLSFFSSTVVTGTITVIGCINLIGLKYHMKKRLPVVKHNDDDMR